MALRFLDSCACTSSTAGEQALLKARYCKQCFLALSRLLPVAQWAPGIMPVWHSSVQAATTGDTHNQTHNQPVLAGL